MFIISFKKSVIITYLGVVFGIMSMAFAFSKIAFAEVEYIRYSLILLIFAGICDMFDGKIARMCKRTEEEKEFGIQIDSLADTVNFVVLPIVVMLSLGMTSIFTICVYILFVICGISRLGVFNCNANIDGPVEYFTGLPVTSTAIIYPLLGMLHGQISEYMFSVIYIIATLLIAILFITKIKIPKIKHIAYCIVITILAIILSILLLVVK